MGGGFRACRPSELGFRGRISAIKALTITPCFPVAAVLDGGHSVLSIGALDGPGRVSPEPLDQLPAQTLRLDDVVDDQVGSQPVEVAVFPGLVLELLPPVLPR